jgi:hypothetical protein
LTTDSIESETIVHVNFGSERNIRVLMFDMHFEIVKAIALVRAGRALEDFLKEVLGFQVPLAVTFVDENRPADAALKPRLLANQNRILQRNQHQRRQTFVSK